MADEKALVVHEGVAKASELIEKYQAQGAMVFVRQEDLDAQSMVIPEVTLLQHAPDDFHNISGQMMPKSYMTDRIGEATGVSFVAEACGTRRESEDIYVGYAQGKRRLPDGTWHFSAVHEYEFNVEVRSEEDFINDSRNKYASDIAKRKHVLEYRKFARQRAGTGARLKVIRELAGIPTSFKVDQVKRPFVFCRAALNTDRLLEDPATRRDAVQMALGLTDAIYGPQRNVTPRKELQEPEDIEGREVIAGVPDFDAQSDEPEPPWPEDETAVLRRKLQGYVDAEEYAVLGNKGANGRSAHDAIRELLAEDDAALGDLQQMDHRVQAYMAKIEGAQA